MSSRTSLRRRICTFAAAALPSVAQHPASPASSVDKSLPCFFLREWGSHWTASPDSRAIYIAVSHQWMYRLDLSAPAPLLQDPFAILSDRGTNDVVCTPLDLRLVVSNQAGSREWLIVKKLTRLSPEEAAALPKNLRP
jgi:hypothetical protein